MRRGRRPGMGPGDGIRARLLTQLAAIG